MFREFHVTIDIASGGLEPGLADLIKAALTEAILVGVPDARIGVIDSVWDLGPEGIEVEEKLPLFTYGTLMEPGASLACLPGYKLLDRAVYSGGFMTVMRTPVPGQCVHGCLVPFQPSMDSYEGPDYERVRVTLGDGTEAWVYTVRAGRLRHDARIIDAAQPDPFERLTA